MRAVVPEAAEPAGAYGDGHEQHEEDPSEHLWTGVPIEFAGRGLCGCVFQYMEFHFAGSSPALESAGHANFFAGVEFFIEAAFCGKGFSEAEQVASGGCFREFGDSFPEADAKAANGVDGAFKVYNGSAAYAGPFAKCFKGAGEEAGADARIGINKYEVFAGTSFVAGIACSSDLVEWFEDNSIGSMISGDLGGAVRGIVVNYDQLAGLRQSVHGRTCGGKCAGQFIRFVIGGDNDGVGHLTISRMTASNLPLLLVRRSFTGASVRVLPGFP